MSKIVNFESFKSFVSTSYFQTGINPLPRGKGEWGYNPNQRRKTTVYTNNIILHTSA